MCGMDRNELINVLRGWHKAFTQKGKGHERNVQALAEAADMLERGKWISVKDRLPKHGKIVFCYTAFFYDVLQWDDDAEQWVGQYGIHGKRYVTHWMPLPEAPKGE